MLKSHFKKLQSVRGCLNRKNLSFRAHVGYFTSQIDKMFHVYAGLICQRFSPKGEKKKGGLQRRERERAGERGRDVYRYSALAAAHKSPAPTKASAPMC